jgi:pimeloyl-ACP methyl ester carboxylesterase
MTAERGVHYADSGGLQIAYDVMGDGPNDVVLVFDTGSNLDVVGENPQIERCLRRFAEFSRLIRFDMRGAGLSDPIERLPTLEEWVDDVRAVMAAVESDRAVLVGHGSAAQLCLLFAATHPDQTTALVTVNGFARLRRADDYPWGYPPDAEAAVLRFMLENWGTGRVLGAFNPGMAQGPRGPDWLARLERSAASPGRAVKRQEWVFAIDVRDVVPAITTPTLVIQTRENIHAVAGHAQFLVENIAGAQLLELPGTDHSPMASDQVDLVLDAIEEFVTGATPAASTSRSLMTVAFTDIVDSTKLAAEVGDRRWHGLLDVHESVARREVDTARGRLIKFTGDGLLATFDGPARAVQCMKSLGESLGTVGLPIRAGVHTGEVEQIGDDIGGIAVHIAARISAMAGAGELLTSSTVRDLVAGSGLEFDDRGEHELKGVPGSWRVLAVR